MVRQLGHGSAIKSIYGFCGWHECCSSSSSSNCYYFVI
ncbi:hypothetical protein T01_2249 [Trichinella spiralis]|uniref:Uncharacterized protein n=1 Tax=Trichinella spiralis TaxID=6334 RepID=A0A0V0Z4P3_TRISP|nr:hypothetical protein T01_2249 [Trichinella spiralis]